MHDIGKSFGAHRVLRDVEFDLRPGEVHVLAGENGAGKSTLIKILAGIHTDYDGRIELDSRPVRFRSPSDAARHGISVIHQELSLIPAMSVVDNIFLGRERHGKAGWMRFGPERSHCADLLRRLDLEVDPRAPAGAYPLSVQQTIEIAKALAFDARILVMDEPTSALSDPEVDRLFSVIDGLRRDGRGIVYISHKMEEIYRIGDRITVLRDGERIGTASAADLPRDGLVRWMVGRELTEQYPARSSRPGGERLRVEGLTVADPAGIRPPPVRDLSFSVRAGEILGIGGLHGSGASEALAALFGVYGRGCRGRIFLDGRRYVPRSPAASIRNGVALLTNDRKTTGLVVPMSVTRNVTLASIPRYSPMLWMLPRAEGTAAMRHRDALGIRVNALDDPVGDLSGGNQQKVALAKWVETGPRVLLLDEPTRGVDVGAKREIYDLMNRWCDDGIAILLITSEMGELLAMSDRILVMHRGTSVTELSRDEADQETVLRWALGVDGRGTGSGTVESVR